MSRCQRVSGVLERRGGMGGGVPPNTGHSAWCAHQSQLRPGARIVAHHFAMGDRWLPDETRDINGLEIHLWRITSTR